ncbi:MAG: NADH-quinone oxidoreductase subunit M [Elusimicrobiota bacterium]|nr:NADH-quinone oxidoreductase subunit M [Elusimicrobiota bacterium]
MLSLIIWAPLVGALIVLCLPKEKVTAIQAVSFIAAGVSLVASLVMLRAFDADSAAMQFVERLPWIPSLNVNYSLGADGLSYPLVLLTTFMCVIALVGSLGIEKRVKEYFFWFLVLETGMLGVFVALDFILFYVFWELTLVPMYFLIGVWGGPKREFAAIKFFLYTLTGSVFMFLGLLAMYFKGGNTFDILQLMQLGPTWEPRFQILVFLALYLGLAVKIPAAPFHTWLPLAHVEAPTPISVILAAVLLKMGVYGLLRFCYQILPGGFQWFLPYLVLIAVINIVYGALCAMAQTDMKKMVAYSSVNHMGYCLLGIAGMSAAGFTGAVFQMVTHGIITGALFLLVGVVYDRAHTRDISAFGGLALKTPVYAGLMFLTCFASLGLPGLAGFVGEFMCFLGAFPMWKWHAAVSVLGIIATAAFFLRMMQKVFLGTFNEKWAGIEDMTVRELVSVVPLAVLTVWFGVYPTWPLSLMNKTIAAMLGK